MRRMTKQESGAGWPAPAAKGESAYPLSRRTGTVAARLLQVACTALLAACATSTAGTRFVVIESDSYGCGAVDGLGCGLAIAPVLDKMDQLDGVAGSSVSWDGKYFRIEVLPGFDPDRVATAASSMLEGEACCVTAPRGQARPGAPDQWFNSKQTLALSRHEAEVLASDFATEVAAEVALDAKTSERLHVVLHEELERAFERAHAAGGGVHRLWEQLPQTRASFESRLDFLGTEQREQVLACLDRKLEE